MVIKFDIIYLKLQNYMKCHFPPHALQVHNDTQVGSHAQGGHMYTHRKCYTCMYIAFIQWFNRTQLPGVVVCLVVNNLKHYFHINANKQKTQNTKHNRKRETTKTLCASERLLSLLPDNQSLSPLVSAFSVLGRLEKHLVWNIWKSCEWTMATGLIAHRFNLECNSNVEIHSSFRDSSWHSRKFLKDYINTKTRKLDTIKTTR